MLKQYGPVFLIPSAWILTVLTIGYGLNEVFVKNMHIVMSAFLVFFTITGWKKMEGEVLIAWRNVIAVGTFFTLLATFNFYLTISDIFYSLEVTYWVLGPTYGIYKTSEGSTKFSNHFEFLAGLGTLSGFLTVIGLINSRFLVYGLVLGGTAQAASILIASKLDN